MLFGRKQELLTAENAEKFRRDRREELRTAGLFLSPLRGWFHFRALHPRLAPWAAFFRRFRGSRRPRYFRLASLSFFSACTTLFSSGFAHSRFFRLRPLSFFRLAHSCDHFAGLSLADGAFRRSMAFLASAA